MECMSVNNVRDGTASSWSSAEHPLRNDLILQTMFGGVSVSTRNGKVLSSCRLVCRQWYEASLPFWASQGASIRIDKSNKKSLKQVLKVLMSSTSNSNEDGGGSSSILESSHSPYKFRGISQYPSWYISDFESLSDWTLLNRFWKNVCGQWVTSLDLESVDFGDRETFRNVACCRWTPSLDYLRIATGNDVFWKIDDERELLDYDLSPTIQAVSETDVNPHLKTLLIRYDNALYISWTELLQFYPNLQHLELGQTSSDCDVEANRMLNAIAKIRGMDSTKLLLKSLNIVDLGDEGEEHKFPSLMNSFLQNTQLFLEELQFDLGMNTPDAVISGVLSHQSKTLRSLYLGRDAPLRNFVFPTMSSLTSLGLVDRAFDNLHFLTGCPKLESLSFMSRCTRPTTSSIIQTTKEEVMQGTRIPSMTSFSYDHKTTFSAEDIGRLADWMPNLRNISMGHVPLTNEILRMVCKLWPSTLEELRCYAGGGGGGIDDEGITGIPRGCEKLGIRLYPNVTDLKECRLMYLGEILPEASEKSVLFGFLQMPKLKDGRFGMNAGRVALTIL